MSRPFVAAHATRSSNAELEQVVSLEGSNELQAILGSHQVSDLLRRFPARWSSDGLVQTLRKLTPRLYSIASSQRFSDEEVHLTVSVLDYTAFGERHLGTASNHLASRKDDDPVRVFVETNDRFRLPRDGSRDVIMIGPGTGVAPFRAFVQERAEAAATGKNWLFFGDQHFKSEFLYQSEWQDHLKKGSLSQLDLAFSRDQKDKVYVQHRMKERGRQLYDWLERGAYLYVCGDAKRMAPDVERALLSIVEEHGSKTCDQAEEWLSELRQQQRYLRDVY